MNPFALLNSFENFFLKPENREFLLLENLAKIPKKWGLYRPNRKLAVRLIWQPDRLAVDRPVDRQRSYFWPLGKSGRPPYRPPRYREQTLWSGRPARSTARIQRARLSGPVDRACVCQTCTSMCTSVDRKGRPAFGAVDPCGRPSWPVSHCSGTETQLKHFSKNSFKSCKNLQK